jgi:outer membrane protein assembly factor BamB
MYVQNGAGGSVAVAINKNDGKIIWKSQARGNGSYSSPILADVNGSTQLIVYAAAGPIAMNPANGRTIWQYSFQNDPEVNASDPVYRDGHLFFTAAYERGSVMLQLSPKGSKKIWDKQDLASRFQPALLDGDALYVNSEGTLTCLQWPTNKILWTMPNADRNLLGMGGSMVRINKDKLILLSQSGRLSLVKATPQEYKRIATVGDVVEGGEVWASPAIHDGRICVRGENELVCLDIKSP